MVHILQTSHEELERTHRLIETYKPLYLKSKFYSFFPRNFKSRLQEYAEKKECFLLAYKELHTNIHSKKIDPFSTDFIVNELSKITDTVDDCSKSLSTLVAHSHVQEDIILHEKVFFVKLLESFHDDILEWVGTHENEVFGETHNTESSNEKNPIKKGIEVLKIKKHKLEEYIKTNSKTN